MRFHLDMQTERNAGLVRFGGVEHHEEAARGEYRARVVEDAFAARRHDFCRRLDRDSVAASLPRSSRGEDDPLRALRIS